MINNPWLYVIVTAVGFGGWPLVARFSGLSPMMTSITIAAGTLIPLIVAKPFFTTGNIGIMPVAICVLAGAVNGIGFITYNILITNKEWVATYVPLTIVCMTAFMIIGGIVLFKDPLSIKRIIGFAFGILSIWFLTK